MDPFGWPDRKATIGVRACEGVLTPDAGREDDRAGADGNLAPAEAIAELEAGDFPILVDERRDRRVVGDGRSALRGAAEDRESQSGIVGPAVVIDVGGREGPGFDAGCQTSQLAQWDVGE